MKSILLPILLAAIVLMGLTWPLYDSAMETVSPLMELDVLLPEAVLMKTTPEERMEIAANIRLRGGNRSSRIPWLPPAAITIVALTALIWHVRPISSTTAKVI
jgi:hypothetical protein